MNDGGRFLTAMPGVIGKRLTYKTLIGSVESEVRKATDNIAESADGPLPN
jgi:hypothetical protein